MAKYNWKELEKEYILGEYKSVSEFLKEKEVPNNGSTRKKTSGWGDKKRQKDDEIKTKTVQKVIEKESEKVSDKIVNVKNVAEELLNKINTSITELNKYISKATEKTKTIEFNYKVGKPSKEVTKEVETLSEYISIIDRNGVKQLAAALKDVNDILNSDNNKNTDEGEVIIIDDLPKLSKPEKNNKNK